MEASILRLGERKLGAERESLDIVSAAKNGKEVVHQLFRTGYIIHVPEYWPDLSEIPADTTNPRSLPAVHPAAIARTGSDSFRHAHNLISRNR